MPERDFLSPRPRLSWLQVVTSVLAAAFGVQSSANRERDFTHGSPKTFIIAGIIFTAMFVSVLLMLVRWVLA